MLTKLLKYELQATTRTFLPLYIMILIVSLVNRISILLKSENSFVISSVIIFGLFAGLFAITALFTISRFYKTLLGDEGYLMNTLPVSTDSLILSKFLSMLLWIVLGCIVAVVSAIIIYPEILKYFPRLFSEFTKMGNLSGALAIICFICSLFSLIFMTYFSISFSQLQPFSNYRIASAFGCFIGINVIFSIISNIAAKLSSYFINWDQVSNSNPNLVLLLSIFINVAVSVVFYFGTRHILNNKLNLE